MKQKVLISFSKSKLSLRKVKLRNKKKQFNPQLLKIWYVSSDNEILFEYNAQGLITGIGSNNTIQVASSIYLEKFLGGGTYQTRTIDEFFALFNDPSFSKVLDYYSEDKVRDWRDFGRTPIKYVGGANPRISIGFDSNAALIIGANISMSINIPLK